MSKYVRISHIASRGPFITFLGTTTWRQGRWVAESGITFPFKAHFKYDVLYTYIPRGPDGPLRRASTCQLKPCDTEIFHFTWQLTRPCRTVPWNSTQKNLTFLIVGLACFNCKSILGQNLLLRRLSLKRGSRWS